MPKGDRNRHTRTRARVLVYEVKGPDNWSRLLRGAESAVPDEVLRRKRSRYRGHAICLYGPKVGVGPVSQCRRNDENNDNGNDKDTARRQDEGLPSC